MSGTHYIHAPFTSMVPNPFFHDGSQLLDYTRLGRSSVPQ